MSIHQSGSNWVAASVISLNNVKVMDKIYDKQFNKTCTLVRMFACMEHLPNLNNILASHVMRCPCMTCKHYIEHNPEQTTYKHNDK